MDYKDFKTVRNIALLIISILGISGVTIGVAQDNWFIVGELTGIFVGVAALLSYMQFSVFGNDVTNEIKQYNLSKKLI